MSSNKIEFLTLIGTLIGFSIAIGFTVMKNDELKGEVQRQTKSALNTTAKLVNCYKEVANYTVGDTSRSNIENKRHRLESQWDRVIKVS